MTEDACVRAPRRTRRQLPDAGFTLMEVLIASTILLLVAASALGFVVSHTAMARAQADGADVQQRARVVAALLADDLRSAGSGLVIGLTDAGLACCVPTLLPRRIGLLSSDPAGTAREDVISVVRAATGGVTARVAEPLSASVFTFEAGHGCPPAEAACGVREGDALLVFAPGGEHDYFTAGPPAGATVPVVPRQEGPPLVPLAGASVLRVETRTYYFDAASRQIRQYDGNLSDVPVIDDVVAARVEYWGEAGAPAAGRLPGGQSTCWYDADGAPRLGSPTLPGAPLQRLPIESLGDGPWCGTGVNMFDADLLRVRRVRLAVRVAAPETARGSGSLFAQPGIARDALRLVPDLEVEIDVTPRALNAGR